MYAWSFCTGNRTIRPPVFHRLIAAAVHEVKGRHPDYFSCCEIRVPFIEALASQCRKIAVFEEFSHGELATALVRGVQSLDGLGLSIRLEGDVEVDSISMLLMKSVLDAYLASRECISLQAEATSTALPESDISDLYFARQTASGISYLIGRGTGPPLLVLSTTGAPLRMWASLLKDVGAKRRCVVVKSRAGSLIEGGTPNKSCLLDDVADVSDVLEAEDLRDVNVLAWCNAARVAVILASEIPERVSSLFLLSPTFRGSIDPIGYASPFEDAIWTLHESVTENPAAAPYLLRSLLDQKLIDISGCRINPLKAADEVLLLAPHEHRDMLLLPLSTVDFFRNYMGRVASDEGHGLREVIPRVHCPILLVTGTHDGATSVNAARDMLRSHGRDVSHVTIFGAGHHIHLLQHNYFRSLVNSWMSGKVSLRTMRLTVEHLTASGVRDRTSLPLHDYMITEGDRSESLELKRA